ncbi:hypothetical protein F2P56_018810 [Juglans regia]|uniref:Uncharacterized protein LOC109019239 n=2 Tax=Juglans regia TaxID=51240 RepID=A0A6P9EYI1_JUGRE|nr:uncharacterized protein LOC109019239 [Juglans regia]XP_035548808.1 uncharacterized protein LOC109019239 [Juglans regia]KAF5462837.1 hypothetical protein F2P56_018810 [Juglans regia]
MQSIEFPFHDHPLILNEETKKDGKIRYCRVCLQRVRGPNYSCEQDWCVYVVHKSCVEPPSEIQHPLHPEHTLKISTTIKDCDGGCNEYRRCYMYNCSHCNFNLHQDCALLPLTIKTESHDHPLTLLRKSLSFTCDACGEKRKCMSYFCMTCSFMVHTQCALFPLNLTITSHNHPLSLNLIKNSPQLNQSENQQICHLCFKRVNTKYKCYYCSSCDFVAHPLCATNFSEKNEAFDPEFKDDQPILSPDLLGPDESSDTLAQIVNKITPENGKAEIVTEIKHISHEHNLKLAVDELENNEKCNGCTQYLSSDPYYCCLQCKFFLHKSCADLPRKKLHPLHDHPLTLVPNKFLDYDRLLGCDACDRQCNGFVYSCASCRFKLDVPCSLIPKRVTHKGHEHPLIVIHRTRPDFGHKDICNSCGERIVRETIYCGYCQFKIGFCCATLPLTIKYWPYEKPFILSYSIEDDSSHEYYCDICEEKRDPKHWFYYCEDISFAAHTRCIMGKYPRIKVGSTYTFDFHEHPLTFVERDEVQYPKCLSSSHDYGDDDRLMHRFFFLCVKCDFIVGDSCLWKIRKRPHSYAQASSD